MNGPAQDEKAEAIRDAVDRMLHDSEIVNVNAYLEKELKVMCMMNKREPAYVE